MLDRGFAPPSVAALAGRRVDPKGAKNPHFPPDETKYVARKLLRHFRKEHIKRLVCSAACGADILALEAAEELDIPATVILPFAPQTFREISVTDRPGNWGDRFDRLITAAHNRNDLLNLGYNASLDSAAFTATNRRIIHEALALGIRRKFAFVVWEGQSWGAGDSTAEFLEMALSQGFKRKTVFTKRRGR